MWREDGGGMAEISPDEVLDRLKGAASEEHRSGLARHGIPRDNALGVPMEKIKHAARRFEPVHEIAFSIWNTEAYEVRLMVVHLADPARIPRAEVDEWTTDFDNWAPCDADCLDRFYRTPFREDAAGEWTSGNGASGDWKAQYSPERQRLRFRPSPCQRH